MDPQYFWTLKLFGPQNFQDPKFAGPQNFYTKFLRYEILFGLKNISSLKDISNCYFLHVTHNFCRPKFCNTQFFCDTKGFGPLTSLAPKKISKKSDQVDYLTIEYFESSRNLENLELECGPAQPNLFLD